MTEVVADFTGKILTEEMGQFKPVKGRVLLNREQLVLASKPINKKIILSEITSVHTEPISGKLSVFFDDVISLIYERDDDIKRVIIGGELDTISKFTRVLFMILIGKETVLTKHPEKKGGRVLNKSAEKMKLNLNGSEIVVANDKRKDKIHINRVVGFNHIKQKMVDKSRPTLVLDYVAGETTVTSCISLLSERKLKLLSRFARLRYDKINSDLNMSNISEAEVELLVSIYSTGQIMAPNYLTTDNEKNKNEVMEKLHDNKLIDEKTGTISLTHKGKIAVNRHYADS